MSIDEFGNVVSSSLDYSPGENAGKYIYNDNSLYYGVVTDVYQIDDSNNTPDKTSATFILYDVKVTTNEGATEIIKKCRMLQSSFGGGINNFFEVLQTDPGSESKKFSKDSSLKRGHHVLVAFIEGYRENGIILGSMPHPNKVAVSRRPKKADGVHTEGEIQGLNFKIDNDGALTIIFNGPRDDKGVLVNQNGPTDIKIDKTGNFKVSTNSDQSIEINRETNKVTVTNGPTKIVMDQKANKIQLQSKIVEIGDGSLQPAVVGDDWKSIMDELITEITNIIVPTGVGPSGTPTNAAKFMSIKGKLKDALSKNHKVEK